jgi:hypothetical protein
VDFNCPYCDTELHLGADLAGKKTPCPNPECRRIIDVPKLVKTQRKDWRDVKVGGPSMARRDEGPAPEGAWASTAGRVVSREALLEAKAVKGRQYPKTVTQKVLLPTLLTVLVVGAGVGYWVWHGQSAQKREDDALKQALEFTGGAETVKGSHAAIHREVAEYHLHSGLEKSGVKAREHFGKAQATLTGEEREDALAELAAAEVELGGDGEDVQREVRLKWDEVQKILRATLAAMNSPEARREALGEVVRRLIAHNQADRVLPLIGLVYSGPDVERSEALAVAGLVFLNAGDNAHAEKAAEQALARYASKEPPPVRAAIIALAMALGKAAPKPGKGPDEDSQALIGRVEGLARQGKWDEARAAARTDKFGSVAQFKALLGLANAAVDMKTPDAAQDVEKALAFLVDKVRSADKLSWEVYRLARNALRTGLADDRLKALADKLPDAASRGRVQLELLKAQLAREKPIVLENAADAVEPHSVAGLLAQTAVARANVRANPDWAKGVTEFPEPQRAFASVGVALGLQDRRK